jgi:hypothetical protein
MSPEAVHKMKGQSVYKVLSFAKLSVQAYAHGCFVLAIISQRRVVTRLHSLPDDLRQPSIPRRVWRSYGQDASNRVRATCH